MTDVVRRWFVERGGALVLVVLVTYLLLAPTTIVDGDNAEFTTVGAIGGRPHPSGYPAYVLWLRATSWLPGSTPAHTAALATALLGVLVVLVLHAACRAWGARPYAATLATALYAASPVVLRMHTEAEVFAANSFVVALILWLAAAAGPVRGLARGFLLGLTAGVGMGNHLTCILIAPVGLLGVVRAVRERSTRKVGPLVGAVAGLAIGLATYGYLLVADGPSSFGQVDGFDDILRFFLRSDYGGPGAFVPNGVVVTAATNLGALAQTLGRAWLWLPGLAGLVSLARAAWSPQRPITDSPAPEPPWGWRMLLVSLLVAGPLLVYRFNIEPTGLGLYVCQRFHLLPVLLLTLPVALAFTHLIHHVKIVRLGSPWIGAVVGIAVYLALVIAALPRLRAQHSPAMERGAHNLLQSLPPHAVVLVGSEDICFATDYLQGVRHERSDVDVVCWPLTSQRWYRKRLAGRGLALIAPFAPEASVGEADAILAHGRPLFVDRSHKTLLDARPSYPYGLVVRILNARDRIPPLPEIVAMNQQMFATFDLDYPRPGPDDDYATMAQKRYAATWIILASALDKVGNHRGANDALELARQLAPAKD